MANQYLISKFKKKKSLFSNVDYNPNEYRNKRDLTKNTITSEGSEGKTVYYPGAYNFAGGVAHFNQETFVLLAEDSNRLLAENNDVLNS